MQIYVHRHNQQLGPFSEADVRAQLAAGTLSLKDHAWWEGQATWIPLAQTPFASGAVPSPLVAPTHPGPAAPHLAVPSGRRTSGLAIGSLISGLMTFFCGCPSMLVCGVFIFFYGLPALLAIVLGHLALSEIKKDPAVDGRGLAISGLVLGYISVLLGILYLILVMAFFMMGTSLNKMFPSINSPFQPVPGINYTAPPSPGDKDNDENNSTNDSSTNAPPEVIP